MKNKNIYHDRIYLYLLKHGSAKSINEIAGEDTNFSPYKKAMYDLLELGEVIKPEGFFELAKKEERIILDNEGVREFVKDKEKYFEKSFKDGKLNIKDINKLKPSKEQLKKLGDVLNTENKKGDKLGEEIKKQLDEMMNSLSPKEREKLKRKTKSHLKNFINFD